MTYISSHSLTDIPDHWLDESIHRSFLDHVALAMIHHVTFGPFLSRIGKLLRLGMFPLFGRVSSKLFPSCRSLLLWLEGFVGG